MSLVFKETKFDKLEKGTKYIIKRYNKAYYNGRFMGYRYSLGKPVSMFEEVNDISKKKEIYVWNLNFYDEHTRTYHNIVKQTEQRQNAMELRAINKLLRLITGDTTFNY
jgi:hypothetical protein